MEPTYQRLILTIDQARDLQVVTRTLTAAEQNKWWPGPWTVVLSTEIPEKEDSRLDDAREEAALQMIALGCRDEQIALQLNWRLGGGAIKSSRRLAERLARKTK